ncbi:MAG: NCS2 family permease [Burkholderiales bacterium]|nr:NCS2 family permease [Burkholderiales bacterium]
MLNKLFSFNHSKQPLNISKECIGGLINFMAIAYIIVVNPLILHANGAGFPIAPAITSTVLIIVVMTIAASFIIKLPFVLAPGMGINAIIAYTLVLHDKLPIPTVLGVILFSSLLLFIFSVTRIRQLIIHAIPDFLQIGLSAGIGFFLFLIGAKNVGLIISNPNTIIGIGHMNLPIVLCLMGFIVASVLFIKRKTYAFLVPIIVISLIYAVLYPATIPQSLVQLPDFSLFMQIDFLAALKLSVLPAILSLFIVNFFDATSTTMGLLSQLHFDSQHEKGVYLKRALVTDSIGGILASFFGVSPSVIFVESSAAIQNGAKTGLASLVTALLCIPFMFLSPLIAMIPSAATSPVLMLVGLIMLSQIRRVKVNNFEDIVAVALTVVMMPLCSSITAGAIFGIVSYTIFKLLLGKTKEISPTLIVIAMVCCGWFWLN